MTTPDLRLAAQKADLLRIEAAKIEGSLRVIRDLYGFEVCVTATQAALQRVARSESANDNAGWVA
ncbi:MAG: hypothetical protein V7672_00835 [Brevundimonas sp.]|uniref:hypothetical protein n=1 Tax=Brevundimonas sp. TaxID=1871086 RepID=UPI00300153BD